MLENVYAWKALLLAVVALGAFLLQHAATGAVHRGLEVTGVPGGSIIVNIVRCAIWTLALLVVLEPVFGIQPTAFMAALGVTSIALSFGLQTTISNVISGIGLMVGRVIEVGDWIEVGGYQGVVTDITWRSTTIKALIGDVICIPNSVLNTTTLRKLAPLSARAVTVAVEIDPSVDMVKVERDLMGAVEAATKVWRDPALPIDLIAQGFGTLGFRVDVRVPLVTIDDGLVARRAIMEACAGKDWMVHLADRLT